MRPDMCTVCGRRFKSTSFSIKHLRRRHGVKIWQSDCTRYREWG